MSSKPSLCIINYNGARHLRRSLPAAWALRQSFAEIVLVDDASTDEALAWVAAEFPAVRIVRHEVNRGPASARNTGIRVARSDRILFADNDVVLLPGCAEVLMAALDAHPAAAVAAATVLDARHPDIIQYDGAGAHFAGQLIPRHAGMALARRRVPPVRFENSLITCCFMLDRGRIDAATRFDDDIPMYFEDHDFGLTLRERGHLILSVAEARVLHGEGTEGVSIRSTGTYTPVRVRELISRRWYIILKHYQLRTLLLLAPALLLFEAAQLAMVLRRGWWPHWRAALARLVRDRRQLWAKRREHQRRRRVPDGLILEGGPLPLRAEMVGSAGERLARRVLEMALEGWWRLVRPALDRKRPPGAEAHPAVTGPLSPSG